MEDIEAYGQLVESYNIIYKTDEMVKIVEGSSIGHKRINPFPKIIRGMVLESVEMIIVGLLTEDKSIRLREISVYDWTDVVEKGFLDQGKIF